MDCYIRRHDPLYTSTVLPHLGRLAEKAGRILRAQRDMRVVFPACAQQRRLDCTIGQSWSPALRFRAVQPYRRGRTQITRATRASGSHHRCMRARMTASRRSSMRRGTRLCCRRTRAATGCGDGRTTRIRHTLGNGHCQFNLHSGLETREEVSGSQLLTMLLSRRL